MAYDPNSLFLAHAVGSPFAKDPPDADTYYAALGRMGVLWGRFEQNLEYVVLIMSKAPGAPKPKEGRPRSYRKKIEHLKRYCKETSRLTPMLDYTLDFAGRAKNVGLKRHELFHANWQGFVKGAAEPTVKFANIRWEGERSQRSKRDIPLSELKALADQTHALNAQIIHMLTWYADLTASLRGEKS